jgi:hypothetical protein
MMVAKAGETWQVWKWARMATLFWWIVKAMRKKLEREVVGLVRGDAPPEQGSAELCHPNLQRFFREYIADSYSVLLRI